MVNPRAYGFICLFLLIFSLTNSHYTMGQEYKIHVDSQLVMQTHFSSVSYRNSEINQILLDHWKNDFLFSQVADSSATDCYIHRGTKYPFVIDQIYDNQAGRIANKKTNVSVFEFTFSQLEYWSNHGYPFASFQMDSIRRIKESYQATLILDKGPFMKFDTLFLINKVKTDKAYIEKTLEIDRNAAFSEAAFTSINKKIGRLPYLALQQIPDLAFEDDAATVYLDLKEQASNSFEGVVGLLPGQSSGKVLITGYLDFELNNLFRSGKSFSFDWNRFAAQSQTMQLNYSHPYLLDTRLLFDLGFSLLKQDTSFLNQQWNLSVGTYLGQNGKLKIDYTSANANLISTDPVLIRKNNVVDYDRDLYSLSSEFNNYYIPFGFTNGWKTWVSAAIGQKRIIKNPNIDNQFYDSIAIKSNVLKVEMKFKYQQAVSKQLMFFHQIESGMIRNDQILKNEMFRIGGLRTLRGFNENFFFSDQFVLSRMELRQYFERSSYFMLFYDQLYYQLETKTDFPVGFGVGLALSASNSLFNFAMAIGRSSEIPFDFSNAKIHFGYISKF